MSDQFTVVPVYLGSTISGGQAHDTPSWAQPIQAEFLNINGQFISDPYFNSATNIGGSDGNALYVTSTYNANSIEVVNGTQVNTSVQLSGSTVGGADANDNPYNFLIVPVGFSISPYVSLASQLKADIAPALALFAKADAEQPRNRQIDDAAAQAILNNVDVIIANDFGEGEPYDLQRSGVQGLGNVPSNNFEGAYTDAASWVFAFTLQLAGVPEAHAIAGAAGSNYWLHHSVYVNDPEGVGAWELSNFNAGYIFAQQFGADSSVKLDGSDFDGTFPDAENGIDQQSVFGSPNQVIVGTLGVVNLLSSESGGDTFVPGSANDVIWGASNATEPGSVLDLSATQTDSQTLYPNTVKLNYFKNGFGNSELDVISKNNTLATYYVSTILGGNGVNALDLSLEDTIGKTDDINISSDGGGGDVLADSGGLHVDFLDAAPGSPGSASSAAVSSGSTLNSLSDDAAKESSAGTIQVAEMYGYSSSDSGLTAVSYNSKAAGGESSNSPVYAADNSKENPASGSSGPSGSDYVTFDLGSGNDVIQSSAEDVSIDLGSGTDTLTQAGAGSVIEAGTGTDYFNLSNDVEIVGATASDVLTWFGQELHGALEWGSAQGYWAISGYNDVEYAIDTLGELEAKNILGDILTITDYVGGPGAAYDTAGIYVAVASMSAYKLLDPNKPNVNFISSQFSLANAAWKALTGKPWFPGADPLVLDLTGNGLDLTGESPQSPLFDINNDGFAVHTGWAKPDDGFLVWDDNGTYNLFGTSGTSGFAALAADDANKDGVINSEDPIFSNLMVWQDLNGNGIIDPGELESLGTLGITSINVAGTASSQVVNGNYVTATGSFTYANGSTGEIGDVSFITDNFDTQYTGDTTVSADAAAEPNLKGYGTLTDLQVAMTLNPALISTVQAALATMTVPSTGPSLDALRADVLPVFAEWASSVPLSNTALAPGQHPDVWIELTNNGSQVAATDYLYAVPNPDGNGFYYKLGSGKTLLDGSGNPITSINEAIATAGGNWVDLTGAELDFVERYWGSPIAIDNLLTDPGQYETVLLDTFTAAWNVLNLETVRLAMQGPLASYFAGLSYDTASDTFDVTTDTQLTPMFTAIFSGAPTDVDGAKAWINGWKPILDIVEGNLAPSQGLKATYGYLFASMVAAYEATHLPISINDVATALGIPSSLIYDTGTTLQGATADANILYAASGNQTLIGSGGPDNDVFGSNFGNDTIDNQNVNQTPDILWFATLDPADITAARKGVNLILTDNLTGSQITVLNEFIGFKPDLDGNNLNPVTGDQQIVFADGTVWNEPEIAYAAGLNTEGTNGTLLGTPANDVLDGNDGNTFMEGFGGGDIYLYDRGDGNDTILRSQQDILVTAPDLVSFGPGLTPADVTFTRAGNSPNLMVTVDGDTSDTLTILDQFDSTFTGVFGTQNLNQIDGFEFSDGTQYSAAQVQLMVLATEEAIPNNTIYGFDGADVIDPGVGGNDFMSGGNGDDTYLFGFGYGDDTIQDGMQNILSGTDDTVQFNADVAPSDVSVVRNGDSSNFTLLLSDGSALTILGQFDNTWAGPFGNIQFNQIEHVQFQDAAGTDWTAATIEQMAIASQMAAGGAVYGFWNGAYFDPGSGGDHTMIGEGGTNTYVFGLGYGNDTVDDSSGGEVLFNANVDPDSVSYFRDPTGDLTVVLSDGSELDIENEFHYEPYGLGDILGNQVTTFQFQNSAKTQLTSSQIEQNFISSEEGQKGGTIYSYFGGSTLSGAAGDETLIGVNGANTFLFGQGYGQETIEIDDDGYYWTQRSTGVVLFGQGITPGAVSLVTNSVTGVLEVEIAGMSDTLIIENYAALLAPGFAAAALTGFQFSDGTFWSAAQITTIIEEDQLNSGQHTPGSTLTGPFPDNFVDPGVDGDHDMVSPSGETTYAFGLGYGYDTIHDNSDGGSEILFNTNVSSSSVQFTRGGTNYWDLTITLADGSQLDIANEFLPTAIGFGENLENEVGYFLFQDSAHTELTYAQIESELISNEEANPYSTIYSFYGGDTLSGASGNDTFVGVNGANTILFGLGYGNEYLSLQDDGYYYAPRATANIVFGAGISASSISLVTDGTTGDLSIRINGTTDSLTVANYAALLSGNALSLQFADGTVWNAAKITQVIETNALDLELAVPGGTLTGPFPNNYVDPGIGGGRDIVSSGGNNTYVFGLGYGNDTIQDSSAGGSEILFNPGIDPTNVSFSRGGANLDDLIITLADGSELDIKNEFLSTAYGFGESIENDVGSFQFQDASSTDLTYAQIKSDVIASEELAPNSTIYSFYGGNTLNGASGNDSFVGVNGANTILFGVGDGTEYLMLEDDGYYYAQRASANVVFGNGIDAGSVTIFTDGISGNLTIRINGTSDSLTIENASQLASQSLLSLQFADGTVWNGASISSMIASGLNPALTWYGSATTTKLVGSDYGPNIFYAAPGNDTITFGNASFLGDYNVVDYGVGDGQVVIVPNAGNGTINFGSGVTEADLRIEESNITDNLTIALLGSGGMLTGDAITIAGDLTPGFNSALKEILFADGSTLAIGNSVVNTWVGTSADTILTGSDFGANLFDVGPGNDSIVFGNVSDGGNSQNTVLYNLGDGAVSINPNLANWSSGVIQFGSGISANNIAIETDSSTGDLKIILLNADGQPTGDSITVFSDINQSNFAQACISSLEFADGTSLSISNNSTLTDEWFGSLDTTLVGSDYSTNVFQLAPGGDTVIFGNRSEGGSGQNIVDFGFGDGVAHVDLNGGGGTIVLGQGILESDVIFESNNINGNLTLSLLNGSGTLTGDALILRSDLYDYYGADGYVGTVVFADGTRLAINGPVTNTWIASATNTDLVGSEWGPNVFELAPGGDQVIFGNGQEGGRNQNVVDFGLGDGVATVEVNAQGGTVILGAGITAEDVLFEADNATGNLTISLLGAGGTFTGDELVLEGDLYDYYGADGYVGKLYFQDGTSLVINDGITSTWIGSATDTNLVGSKWGPNIFELAPGGDQVTFGNGQEGGRNQNTLDFGLGDGIATVDVNAQGGTVVLGAGITAENVIFEADNATGNLTILLLGAGGTLTGDELVLEGDLYDDYGADGYVGKVFFQDGTSLAINDGITSTWIGSATDTTLVGSEWGPNIFELAPGGDQVTFGSGREAGNNQNVVDFGVGDGAATINAGGRNGTIVLGTGITESDLVFQSDNAGDLTISILGAGAVTGDSLLIKGDLYNNWGVQSYIGDLVFADGSTLAINGNLTDTWTASTTNTTLVGSGYAANLFELAPGGDSVTFGNGSGGGLDQNTVEFGYGDGAAMVNVNGGLGTIVLAPGITQNDVALESDSAGDLTISLLGTGGMFTGDSLLIQGDLYNDWGVQSRIGDIVFANGSTLAITGSLTDTWIGSTVNTTLVGSGYAANLFELAPGGDSVTFGNGNGGGLNQNTVDFAYGDGAATVSLNGGAGTIVLGTGITQSDVEFQSDSAGDLTISLLGTGGTLTGDSLLVHGDLYNNWGVQSYVGDVVFADGSTLAINGNLTDTWSGTATNKTLVGSGYAANLFELAPGGDTVTLGNGNGGGLNQNTVDFGYGDGGATVNLNGGNGTIQLEAGILLADVALSTDSSGDLILTLADSGDTLIVDNGLTGSGLNQISFANGTVLNQTQITYLAETGTAGADTISLPGGPTTVDGRGGGDTINGGGGYDTYIFRQGYGDLTINNAAGGGSNPTGELDFGPGINEQDLWFSQNGNDLDINVLGSTDQIDLQNYFGSNSAAQLSEIKSYDGFKIDTGLAQLISAMAVFSADNPGFNPETATQMPSDPSLQAAIAAAWHSQFA